VVTHISSWRKKPAAFSAGQTYRRLHARGQKAWFLPANNLPVSQFN
jgi:hypothetical protein